MGCIMKFGQKNGLILEVNCVEFKNLAEAPRERADLARTAILMKMDGQKKTAKFGLLLKG